MCNSRIVLLALLGALLAPSPTAAAPAVRPAAPGFPNYLNRHEVTTALTVITTDGRKYKGTGGFSEGPGAWWSGLPTVNENELYVDFLRQRERLQAVHAGRHPPPPSNLAAIPLSQLKKLVVRSELSVLERSATNVFEARYFRMSAWLKNGQERSVLVRVSNELGVTVLVRIKGKGDKNLLLQDCKEISFV